MRFDELTLNKNVLTQLPLITIQPRFKTRLLNSLAHPLNNLHRGERRNPKKNGKDASMMEGKVVRN